MVIEEVVKRAGDIDEQTLNHYQIEKVYLESSDLLKRIQRVTTDHDKELGIKLKSGEHLQSGDVLYQDKDKMIMVDVVPEELLVIHPRSIHEMGTIAHQLGNRHLPAQFRGDTMVIQYDYLVEELLQNTDIPFTRETQKVTQPFQHVGHSHG